MRYAPEQLRAMARTALAARDAGSPNWTMLVMQLMLRTGLGSDAIELKIVHLAA